MVLAWQFMGNETLWAASHKGELPSCQDIGTLVVRYNDFHLSHDFARPRDQGIVTLWLGTFQGNLPSYQVSWP